MASHAHDDIEYWISVDSSARSALFSLRKWRHLKIATDEAKQIWVRGLNQKEINSKEVLRIPFIKRYYLLGAQLFPFGKKMPERTEPNLLWSPIRRGLKITLPKENFNYFGLDQTFSINLVPSTIVQPARMSIVALKDLRTYVDDAYDIRMQNLQWAILDDGRAIIYGSPLLPIQGVDFYEVACFLIPLGYAVRHKKMIGTYAKALGDGNKYWYVINEENQITKLNRSDFMPLNKGSFNKSLS